jgi:ATP phosphoribosyltransferase
MATSIALPNKGALAEGAAAIFRAAGYRLRSDGRELSFVDQDNGVEFFYLRPRDIATYVASGELDLGITGRDLLADSGLSVTELLALDFGKSRFHFAAPSEDIDSGSISEGELGGKRIATSYPKIVESYLKAKGLTAEVIKLDGAVEGAIKLGVADLIADVVSTGNTLKQAGLSIFGSSILESEAICIGRHEQDSTDIQRIIRRLNGVVIARQYVLVDYDIKSSDLERACQITPGIESPTVSPLQKSGWFAVRAMVKQSEVHQVMDLLWELGARGILVTDIHSSRL